MDGTGPSFVVSFAMWSLPILLQECQLCYSNDTMNSIVRRISRWSVYSYTHEYNYGTKVSS